MAMRGWVDRQGAVFHTFDVQALVPAGHPLREVKRRADAVLAGMSRDFNAAYGTTGRPGIPPERLIKALLLQALYSIRSEIQLCEQIGYNLLFRWFLDMQPSDRVWTPEVFSMNRQRFADVFRPRGARGAARGGRGPRAFRGRRHTDSVVRLDEEHPPDRFEGREGQRRQR
jgi:hypothetical protein